MTASRLPAVPKVKFGVFVCAAVIVFRISPAPSAAEALAPMVIVFVPVSPNAPPVAPPMRRAYTLVEAGAEVAVTSVILFAAVAAKFVSS